MSVEIIKGSSPEVIPTSKMGIDTSDGKVSKFSNITKATKELANNVKESAKNIFSKIGKFFSNVYNKVMSYKRNYDLPENVAIRLKNDLAKQILKQESFIVRDYKGRPTYNGVKAGKQMNKVENLTRKYAQHLVDMGLSSEEIKAKLDEVAEHKTLDFRVQYGTFKRTPIRRPLGQIARAALYDDSTPVLRSAVAKRIEVQLKSGSVPTYDETFVDEISLIKGMSLPDINDRTDKLFSLNNTVVEDQITEVVLASLDPRLLEQQKVRLEDAKDNPMSYITTKEDVLSAERATVVEARRNADATYDTALVKRQDAIDARVAFEEKHKGLSYMDVLKAEVKASPGDSKTSIEILEYKGLSDEEDKCSVFASDAKTCLDALDDKIDSLDKQIIDAQGINYETEINKIIDNANEKLRMIAMLQDSDDRCVPKHKKSKVTKIA
jgi:hypothetical protein